MAAIQSKKFNSPEETFDGMITDVSDSGACLLTTNPLGKGQKITINNASLFSRTAIVRWSERIDSLYHRVGLEFLKTE
jgi:hypothetical protein